MDPVRNPYAPGAGNAPPELAGRHGVIDAADIALQRIAQGRPARSQILVGLRGTGKTVLLNHIRRMADGHGYATHMIEAHEAKPLVNLLVPGLRTILYGLSALASGKDMTRRALRFLGSFVSGLKIRIEGVEVDVGVGAEPGAADSGDLEADLPALMVAIGEAAAAARRPVLVIIDEMQYLKRLELSALIMAVHRVNQLNLPLMMLGAGLPQVVGLAGESKSYAERLFAYPQIGALGREDAAAAIVNPARAEDAEIDEAAVERIIQMTEGYPYFLQQWAYDAWNVAEDNRITAADVIAAAARTQATLDENFFRVRFDRCTPSERRYMRALAEFGPGQHRSGDIALQLGVKTTTVGPIRAKLIAKGMVYAPQHGDTAFTVPLFDAFMRRVMPELD